MTTEAYFEKYYGIDINDVPEDEVYGLVIDSFAELQMKIRTIKKSKDVYNDKVYLTAILSEITQLGEIMLDLEYYEAMSLVHHIHDTLKEYIETIK